MSLTRREFGGVVAGGVVTGAVRVGVGDAGLEARHAVNRPVRNARPSGSRKAPFGAAILIGRIFNGSRHPAMRARSYPAEMETHAATPGSTTPGSGDDELVTWVREIAKGDGGPTCLTRPLWRD